MHLVRNVSMQSRSSLIEHVHPHGFQSRSQSRARPHRHFSLDVKGEKVSIPSRAHSPSRFAARFASAAPSRVQSRSERRDSETVHTSRDDAEYYVNLKDPRGHELDPNSRIWHIYNAESRKHDARMMEGWNRSMDVLLVFTGLFSAVLTTFIIQTYQMMIPDETDTLLSQLVTGFQNDSASRTSSSSSPAPATHWVNGLWFAALACSLSTALISMLAKQWLQAYIPHISGAARQKARIRQSRYMQLHAWHIPAIINTLPILVHVALLLFFAGLIVLLWPADLAITIATWAIVAFAYLFYSTSVWLPLFYKDCPYYHPLTEYIRKAWSSEQTYVRPLKTLYHARKDPMAGARNSSHRTIKSAEALSEDALDAAALIWLLRKSTDSDVVSAALQSLAGLSRDFYAMEVLRDEDALSMVEQAFQDCFYKDTTVDLQWHILDPEGAELYCRAWINLTRGTMEQWPLELIEPLWVLQDCTRDFPDAAAVASCAVALSSFESHVSQWELLAYLAKCTAGEIQLSSTSQCCLLDSLIECLVLWEMPAAVIEETRLRAIPTLLRILNLTGDLPMSNLRSSAALALYAIVRGPVNLVDYRNEESRRADYCELAMESLSVLVDNPERFMVQDALMKITAHELCRLAASIVVQSERFPQQLRQLARSSLSKLYIDGRVGVGLVSDTVLSDVLHLLYPPLRVPEQQRPIFVTTLCETLEISSHPDIMHWSIRLLEILLTSCSVEVANAFAENNGINAVLRATKAGLVDGRRLQIDSLRTLCAFIGSVSQTTLEAANAKALNTSQDFDLIFKSAFFDTLISVVAERRWWVFEVSGHWMPALVKLCHVRPEEDVWRNVIKVFRDFAERNVGEDGCAETLAHLDVMVHLCQFGGAAS